MLLRIVVILAWHEPELVTMIDFRNCPENPTEKPVASPEYARHCESRVPVFRERRNAHVDALDSLEAFLHTVKHGPEFYIIGGSLHRFEFFFAIPTAWENSRRSLRYCVWVAQISRCLTMPSSPPELCSGRAARVVRA